MARKKSALARPTATASATASLQVAPVLANGAPHASVPRGKTKETADRFWLDVAIQRIVRSLGSLPFAIVLLIWFAAVLAVGTLLESWYDGRIAQELVYRTWWFKLLLFLLGTNILFAAAKKWPWKKHQTGFLITHLGLITLVTGGMVTSFSSTDASMELVDTDQSDIQQQSGKPRSSSRAVLSDESSILVSTKQDGKEAEADLLFEPGFLPWARDQYLDPKSRPAVDFLSWLAHPLPRQWEHEVPGGAVLRVLGFYPHARQEDFSAAQLDKTAFPAVKFQLKLTMAGMTQDGWVAAAPASRSQSRDFGPALIEMLGTCSGPLREEFLHPPATKDLGSKGQLVLYFTGDPQAYRFDVDKCLDKPMTAGKNQVRIKNYGPNLHERDDPTPSHPFVEFEIKAENGTTTTYYALARLAGTTLVMKDGHPSTDNGGLQVWFHPPDYRWGAEKRGVLQFAVGDRESLYYRSFHSNAEGFGLESSGQAQVDEGPYPIWGAMKGEFSVKEYLPRAQAKVRYVPVDARPGLQKADLNSAIRCVLAKGNERSDEFWLSQVGEPQEISLGKESYHIGYRVRTKPLDFDVKLLRAEQGVDEGTQHAASYTSFVQLFDTGSFRPQWVPGPLRPLTSFFGLTGGGEVIDGEDRIIWMNHPLNHRGYKLYQSNYRFVGWDDNARPVSYSGFTVAWDPGLWLKYLGSTMLALGIACMFYMKAYFFKPRGRRNPAAGPAL